MPLTADCPLSMICHFVPILSSSHCAEMKKKDAKKAKDAEKKQLRKAKQLFRKLTMSAFQAANPNDSSVSNGAIWDDLEQMNDDVSELSERSIPLSITPLPWFLMNVCSGSPRLNSYATN